MLVKFPVAYLECPDTDDPFDHIVAHVDLDVRLYAVKHYSHYSLYTYHPSSRQQPFLLYADLGQWFHVPDIMEKPGEEVLDDAIKARRLMEDEEVTELLDSADSWFERYLDLALKPKSSVPSPWAKNSQDDSRALRIIETLVNFACK